VTDPAAGDPGFAVVTGASSGIGRAFAESLAARGYPLVLVARREERLRALADRAGERHGVEARVVPADLTTDAGLAACRAAVDALPAPPAVLVLNAGFGTRGPLWALDRGRETDMVRLNCLAVVDLAVHALPGMVARGRGAVVVVSSAAAWQPVPHMATYAATKAFELAWTEALAVELRGTGVRALAVCPGPTRTEFSLAAGSEVSHWWIPFNDVDLVVRSAWRALAGGRRRAPAGLVSRGSMLASRILPRGLILWGAALTHRRPRALKGSDRHT
jgi:short-subunit dehydrogenase